MRDVQAPRITVTSPISNPKINLTPERSGTLKRNEATDRVGDSVANRTIHGREKMTFS